MSQESLEKRIQILEDIEDIKRLKHRYCALCDAGYDADGLAELFVENAIWDGQELGRSEGKEQIREFFRRAPERLPFAIHMMLNPIIYVNADQATGTWYLFQTCTYAGESDQAVWGSARYDEKYVRTSDGWKFQDLKLTSHFWTPFDQGWVKTTDFLGRL